jgi:hypothetical protein
MPPRTASRRNLVWPTYLRPSGMLPTTADIVASVHLIMRTAAPTNVYKSNNNRPRNGASLWRCPNKSSPSQCRGHQQSIAPRCDHGSLGASAVAGSAASDLHAPNLFSLGEPAQLSRSLGISRLMTFWTINAAKSHPDLLAITVYREGVAIRYFGDWTGVKQLLGNGWSRDEQKYNDGCRACFHLAVLASFCLPTQTNPHRPG